MSSVSAINGRTLQESSEVPARKSCLRQQSTEPTRAPRRGTADCRFVSWPKTAAGAVWNSDWLNTGFVKQARDMFASAEDAGDRKIDTSPSTIGKLVGRFFLAIPATIVRAVGTILTAIGGFIAGGIGDIVRGCPTTISFNETVAVVTRQETPRFVMGGIADPNGRYAFAGDTTSFDLGEFDRLPNNVRASVLKLPPGDTFASSALAGAVDIEEITIALQPGDIAQPKRGKLARTRPSSQDCLNAASLRYAEDGSTVLICEQQMRAAQVQIAPRDRKDIYARALSDANEALAIYRETEAEWRELLASDDSPHVRDQYALASQRRQELEEEIAKYRRLAA
ncbi:hypothetical protein ACUSIJ_07465 [Pseudochelatococcus sp. B33]